MGISSVAIERLVIVPGVRSLVGSTPKRLDVAKLIDANSSYAESSNLDRSHYAI